MISWSNAFPPRPEILRDLSKGRGVGEEQRDREETSQKDTGQGMDNANRVSTGQEATAAKGRVFQASVGRTGKETAFALVGL